MKKYNRIGEKHITNQGYEIEIISYAGAHNISAMFTSSGLVLSNVQYGQVKKKNIVNPYHPTYRNVGFFGVGTHKMMVNNKFTKSFSKWLGILERCYSEEYLNKKPTYRGMKVCEEWLNFQVFAEWFHENYNSEYMQDWQLDKDIICSECKIYSPETCCFVPNIINSIFRNTKSYRGELPIGVIKRGKKFGSRLNGKDLKVYNTIDEAFGCHKFHKEKYIKELAEQYKNKISDRCYQAMHNYKVEIDE